MTHAPDHTAVRNRLVALATYAGLAIQVGPPDRLAAAVRQMSEPDRVRARRQLVDGPSQMRGQLMGAGVWELFTPAERRYVHFLYSVGIGRYFPKLATWAKKIGAPTTVAYAKAASAELKALNGGTLPSMGDARRIATMHALEEHDEAAGGRGLFDGLDQEYRVLVTAELTQTLRAYVREHVEEIERELFAAVEGHRAQS